MTDSVETAITQAEGRLVGRLQAMSTSLRAMFDSAGRRIVENETIVNRLSKMESGAESALDDYGKEISAAADPFLRAFADASERLKEAEQADLIATLTPTDVLRAGALRDFASDAAGRLALADLASRIREIAREKDRAAAVVYHAEGTKRLHRERGEDAKAGHFLQTDPGLDDLEQALAGLEPIALGAELVARRARLQAEVQKNENTLTRFGNAIRKFDDRELRDRFGLARPPLWGRLFKKAGIEGAVFAPDGPPGTY